MLCMMHVWWNSTTSGNERLVLLAIADEADDDGRNAYPSVRRLADKVNCHTATVLRAILSLERAGEIEVVRPTVRAPGRCNKYKVLMDRVPTASEIRARYAGDSDEKTARKMQPKEGEDRAHASKKLRASRQKPRASVRADPMTPNTDPAEKRGTARIPAARSDCERGCTAGIVELEDGSCKQCECLRAAAS